MDVFYSIGLAQVLFSLILIGKKRNYILADKALLALLTVFGLELSYSWLNAEYITGLPDIVIIPYAIGPLLYLYCLLLSSEKASVPKRYYLHFVPFLFFLLTAPFLGGYFTSIEPPSVNTNDWGVLYILNFALLAVSFVYYWLKVIKLLQQHKVKVLQTFSFESENLNLDWLKFLSAFIFGGFVLFILLDSVFYFIGGELFPASVVLDAGILITVYSISFYGFKQEAIFEEQQFVSFSGITKKEVEVKGTDTESELDQLFTFIKEQKPYLKRNLTLQDVANAIGMPAYRLSELINGKLNKNFFTLINEFRIEEVKQRIGSKEHKLLTLSAIGFDAGFNSKSSFQSLFKKHTGMTPSQYKRKIQET